MPNRDALRNLSKKIPAPPEIEKIMEGLNKETDIAVAIVAAAILEASLERLIESKFRYAANGLRGQIFSNQGPLSSFHAKILVAHAFGIITPNMAEEMHSIKSIRNAFAHAKTPISFENEFIAKEVNSLRMLLAIKAVESKTSFDLPYKIWFLLIIKILLILIDSATKSDKPADEVLAESLGNNLRRADD